MNPFTPEWFFSLGIFILPAFVSNSAALYFDPARHGKKSTPVDFGWNFIDGKRIIGKKGIEGMSAAILAGWFVGAFTGFLDFRPLGFSFDQWFWVSLYLAIGTQVGDKVGSFVKRRLGLPSGSKFEYFDQLGFVVFALAFASIAEPAVGYSLGAVGYVTLLAISYFTHAFANWFAFKIKLKDVPW